jgi:hypothetical protein
MVNLLWDNTDTMKKNNDALTVLCTTMSTSHYQNAGQNHNLNTANRYFEYVAKFRYLGITLTNKN